MPVAIGVRMKTLALGLVFAFASAGCLSTLIPDPKPASGAPDMASGGTGGNGSGAGNGSGTGGGNMNGMSADDGGTGDGGGGGGTPGAKAFGDTCVNNSDCQSNICGNFVMGTVHRCTKSCTVATQATDCPAPSDGTCNANGYCKFDQ